MKSTSDKQLTNRIHAFVSRKNAQFPDLQAMIDEASQQTISDIHDDVRHPGHQEPHFA